jgi:hypothetical protein
MSFEEILDAAAADAGRVVKAITFLGKGSSSGDSYLSRHTSRHILLTIMTFARALTVAVELLLWTRDRATWS